MLSLEGLSSVIAMAEGSTHARCCRRPMLHRDTLAAASAIYKGKDQMTAYLRKILLTLFT